METTTPKKENVFSFVTLRAPELMAKDKEIFFIKHPNPTASALFDNSQAGFEHKLVAFQSMSAKQIIDRNAALYAFGEKVLKGRTSLSADAFADLLSNFNAATTTMTAGALAVATQEDLSLWDNFIYQAFTSKDGAAREAALVMLYAGFLRAYSPEEGNEKELARMLQARIVIPKEFLFPEENAETVIPELTLNPVTKTALESSLARVKSAWLLPVLKNISGKLCTAEKKYGKDQQKARQDFMAAKATADKAAAAAAKAAFIANGGNIEDDQSSKQGNLASVDNFVPAPFDIAAFAKALTGEDAAIWDDLFKEGRLGDIEDIKQQLSENIAAHSKTMLSSVSFNRTFIPVNGVMFKGGNMDPSLVFYAGQFCPLVSNGVLSVNAAFTLPAGDTVAAATAKLLKDEEEIASDEQADVYPNTDGTTGLLFFDNNTPVPPASDNLTLKITITLQSGRKYLAEGSFSLTACNKVVLKELVDLPGEEVIHYGVTRLGIADYRTVQQYVCCYVPGEVSHIENIMAREYKERSTRRLRRSETTDTSETTTEKESLTDTTATDRHEMQQEVSKVISEAKDYNINAGINWTNVVSGHVDAGFAAHTTKEQSNDAAVTNAKEITQKAEEKITQKVREERIVKIIDEFEEQNKHGFDNRISEEHVSGVYRWVDKIYNNEIHNYGKRLMYEFMVPEPAAFHKLAVKTAAPDLTGLIQPRDFRSVTDMAEIGLTPFGSHKDIKEVNYAILAAAYGAQDIQLPPQFSMTTGLSLSIQPANDTDHSITPSDKIAIPDGYEAVSGSAILTLNGANPFNAWVFCNIGKNNVGGQGYHEFTLNRETVLLPVSLNGYSTFVSANIEILLQRTAVAFEKWQLDTWNAVVSAYNLMQANYEQRKAELETAGEKGTNPLFLRDMELTSLRKSCISYLLDDAKVGVGFITGTTLQNIQVLRNANLAGYASQVKFIEQAFEWDIMSYQFYPFYWAEKSKWTANYFPQSDDKLFAKFLQSGMARVIVTVRPGFEDAVNWFMATGQIWEGSTAPVINDPLYLSIVDELQNPESTVEETWETRVPTSLTIIQAGSIGLTVDEGLPCSCGDATGIVRKDNTLAAGTVPPAAANV